MELMSCDINDDGAGTAADADDSDDGADGDDADSDDYGGSGYACFDDAMSHGGSGGDNP
jgi:hypothetical protein